MVIKHYYLVEVQYLGYRFHGWQKQKELKTVHYMIDRTIKFVLKHDNFKTLGTSRTDAMVSANHSAFELFTEAPIDIDVFLKEVNFNIPFDIKLISIKEIDNTFNIINTPKIKHYYYLFASGNNSHPFSASLLTTFRVDLDIKLMKEGAELFLGTHNFIKYVTKPNENTNTVREVLQSVIVANTEYTASFFPQESYLFKISSVGFMRNQVRLMMGQLVKLGKHEITLEELEKTLLGTDKTPFNYIAPASGLMLHKTEFFE